MEFVIVLFFSSLGTIVLFKLGYFNYLFISIVIVIIIVIITFFFLSSFSLFICLFSILLEFTSGSSSGSGSGANLGVNRPPTILGCPPNDTLEESEVEQSPRIIEVSLKTPNLTFTDPDGDNFTVTTNLTSSPSLSNINITNTNETSILVEIHGNELGTMVNRLKLLIKWSVVDTLDEESSCILKYHIQLSTPSICNNTGPTLQLTPQKRDSIELLVSGGSFRVRSSYKNELFVAT